MADFVFCVNEALKAKAITKANAERILSSDNPEQAVQDLTLELSQAKKEKMVQSIALNKRYKELMSVDDKGEGLIGLMTKSDKTPYANIEKTAQGISAVYHSKVVDFLTKFRTRKFGLSQDKEGLKKLVDSMMGKTIDDAEIAGMAKTLSDVFEDMRLTFNKLGGSIGKNESWALPQTHDARKLIKMGKDAWIKTIKPMLDRSKMTDDAGKVLTDAELDEALGYSFDSITTGGLNKIQGMQVVGMGKKLSRRHADRRFLYFKDSESWIKYNEELGQSDIFTTLTSHIDMMSHDIALIKMFGANPEQTYKALRLQAKKEGASALKLGQADKVWNVASGKVHGGELLGLADVSQTMSNVITFSHLGGAFISALSDAAFNGLTSYYRGVSPLKVLGSQMRLMSPNNEADRIFAVRLGLTAESWTNMAHSANRWADIYGVGATAKTAEVVMRASLLASWTDSGRHAFGMEFSALLADNFKKSFDKLPKELQQGFSEYGITKQDWDIFRANKTIDQRGAPYADLTANGSEKFRQMILSEMDYSVPTPDYRVRGFTTAGLERASVMGTGWRTLMTLKTFPITLLTTHFRRMLNQQTMKGKLAYGTALFGSTTILGGLALQAKDIAAGREPRNMDVDGNSLIDGKFLKAAIQQGGGLGIYGDFVFSDQNRFGNSLAETLAGPKFGMISDISKVTLGNIQQLAAGEDTRIGGELVDMAATYQPKIWQTKLFQDNWMDWLETQADPKAEAKFRRREKMRKKEYGQDYWWKPAQILPEAAK